jgi:hypothetical protein
VIIIGFGLAWAGYSLVFYGLSLVHGYDLSFTQVFSPVSYYKGTWPPALAPDTSIFPGQKAPAGS